MNIACIRIHHTLHKPNTKTPSPSNKHYLTVQITIFIKMLSNYFFHQQKIKNKNHKIQQLKILPVTSLTLR